MMPYFHIGDSGWRSSNVFTTFIKAFWGREDAALCLRVVVQTPVESHPYSVEVPIDIDA
jgi:hypothetical protein